ncbi:MAG: cytochrome C, partial [bacterium]|nr:cytochrome C [bacterium]
SVNVRSHTFRFITPGMTEDYNIPNPCTSCHADRTNEWAAAALLKWRNVSPWRVGH